jgi:hypothetical protein
MGGEIVKKKKRKREKTKTEKDGGITIKEQ